MTFLTPIPMLIAAGLATPVLLAYYFLKLRRRPVRVSSVQFWESSTRDLQVNVPLRMLRPTWLLLLHLLILALFLMALGRPAINTSGAPADRVVILIDTSASMSGADVEPTRLEAAKAQAKALVDDLARSDAEVMVIAFGATPTPMTSFTRNPRELRRAIDAVTPTDQPGDLSRALALVDAFAQGDTDEDEAAPATEAVLFSDGAFADDGARTLRRATFSFEHTGPATDRPANNLAVVGLSGARDPDQPELIRVFARVQSNRAEPAPISLRLFADGEEHTARAVTVPPGTPTALGEAVQTFQLRRLGPTLLAVSIDATDDLVSDNAAALVVSGARRPRILFVSPEGERDGSVGALVINEVLEALRPSRLVRLDQNGFRERGAAFDEFDLVVLDRVRPTVWPRTPTLAFGLDCEQAGVVFDGDPERLGDIVSWDRDAPELTDVTLDEVVVGLAPRVTVSPVEGTRVDELARTRDTGVIFRITGRTNAVLVTFAPDQSNWPLAVGFPIFVANVVDTMGSSGLIGESFNTAEPVVVDSIPGRAVAVVDNQGETIAQAEARADRTTIGVIPRVGVYTVEGGAQRSLAVNLFSPHESALGSSDEIRIAGRTVGASDGARSRPREIWSWFVAAAAGLLLLEWFVYGLQSRV